MFNKNEFKESLDINEVATVVDFFKGEAVVTNFGLTCLTICHNHPDDNPSRKLYYYENTHLFKCFTECNDTFDIFELVIKCYDNQRNERIDLPRAIDVVLRILNKTYNDFTSSKEYVDEDRISKLLNEKLYGKNKYSQEMPHYEDNLIRNLKTLRILDWEKEGISYETLLKYNIRYYPPTSQIVIPHYDEDGVLVGIRGRTVIQEDAEKYGKYRPLIVNNVMYNHPLGLNLYGLNKTKEAIIKTKTAIIFESEKSVLMMDSYFNIDNNSVAVCGSSLSQEQAQKLIKIGVNEIVLAFDRQYKDFKDEECLKWHQKINKIVNTFSPFFRISIIFDTGHLLDYKDSPIDKGKEVFLELYEKRFIAVYD